MKGCFVLHRRFAYIGHYIATHLNERDLVQEFCGIVYTRPSLEFIQKQQDIRYSTMLFNDDIHAKYKTEPLNAALIDQLEKEYGTPFLWPFLTVDRIIMSNQILREYPYNRSCYTHEEMLRLLQVYAKTLTDFLDKEKPDFIFFSVICSTSAFLLYHMAKKRGIKTYIIHTASTRNRCIISEAYDRFTEADALFQHKKLQLLASPSQKEALTHLKEFRENPLPYSNKSTPEQQPIHRAQQYVF